MGFLSSLFGDDEDPSQAANAYLNQIPGIARENLNPYINRGMEAGNVANSQYDRLLKDPTGFIDAILASYEPSKGYEFRENRLKNTAGNAAAQGGFGGTPEDVLHQTDTVNGVLGQDMQQFLQNVLGVYGQGLQGKQGFSNEGFGASNQLTDYLVNNLTNQAGNAYRSVQDENASNNSFFDGIESLGAQLLGGYMARPGAGTGMGRGGFGSMGGRSSIGANGGFLQNSGGLGTPSYGKFSGPFSGRGGNTPGLGFR